MCNFSLSVLCNKAHLYLVLGFHYFGMQPSVAVLVVSGWLFVNGSRYEI